MRHEAGRESRNQRESSDAAKHDILRAPEDRPKSVAAQRLPCSRGFSEQRAIDAFLTSTAKWKGLSQCLEDTADVCETVAHLISAIVVKGL